MSRFFRGSAFFFLLTLFCAIPHLGRAWEGGKSLYLTGLRGPNMGAMAPPGVYFLNNFYFYSGNIEARPEGRFITTDVEADAIVDLMTVSYVTKYKPLGASFSVGALFPVVAHLTLSGDVSTPNSGSVERDTSTTGIGDLSLVPFMLGWHAGKFHYLWDIVVYLPTGGYSENSILNVGKNKIGFQSDFGFTYADPKSGPQANVYTGFTFPLKNYANDYQNGIDWHLDYSGLYKWPFRLSAGAQGYIQQQINGDSGSGALLGSFKGRLIGMGPIISYDALFGTFPVNFNARYMREFLSKNTFSGNAFWFSTSFGF